MAITIKRLVAGIFQANCYILECPESKQALVIDPGGSGHKILKHIKKSGASLQYIILTHGHIDHIMRSRFIQAKTNAPAIAHPADIRKAGMLAMIWMRLKVREVKGGEEIPFAGKTLKILHTPGHSPGSICISLDDILFTGDLLFAGGVGRWDLPRGNLDELMKSLRTRISHLPDSTRIMPGHGPESTLGIERKTNPFFNPGFIPT